MRHHHLRAAGFLAIAAAVAIGGATLTRAQAPNDKQGPAERIGEAIDRTVRDVKENVKDAKAKVHAMGVTSRVYGRLHWDKALVDSAIDLKSDEPCVVILTGTVDSPAAREHAVTLARETVGIDRVVDQLTIAPVATDASKPTDN